jgi:hypothetical protein
MISKHLQSVLYYLLPLLLLCCAPDKTDKQMPVHKSANPLQQQWPEGLHYWPADSSFTMQLFGGLRDLAPSDSTLIESKYGPILHQMYAAADSKSGNQLFVSTSSYQTLLFRKRNSLEMLDGAESSFLHGLNATATERQNAGMKSELQNVAGRRIFFLFPGSRNDTLYGCTEFYLVPPRLFQICIIAPSPATFGNDTSVRLAFKSFMPLKPQQKTEKNVQ